MVHTVGDTVSAMGNHRQDRKGLRFSTEVEEWANYRDTNPPSKLQDTSDPEWSGPKAKEIGTDDYEYKVAVSEGSAQDEAWQLFREVHPDSTISKSQFWLKGVSNPELSDIKGWR